MLKSLFIKDYALIDSIEIEFGKGLNIITGETGAGKSILIDAMGLLLGERASSEVVRKGTEKSIVEGIFETTGNKKIISFCKENDIDYSEELIVRREISLKGTNRCFVDDTPVPLTVVKNIGDLLVDLHGQHEHQSLLNTETHIELLDSFANLESILFVYREQFDELNRLIKELKSLTEKEHLLNEKKDLYQFQIKEIDSVNPFEDEEEKLEAELKILENSEKLLSISNDIYNSLYESENSIQDQLGFVKHKLFEIENIDKSFSEIILNFESANALLNEISSQVRSYKDKVNLEPERLDEVRTRLGSFVLLKKKYGGSIKAVVEYRAKIGDEFNLIENYGAKILELQNKIEIKRKECGQTAFNLSKERITVSKKIKKEVEATLKLLGIADSRFEVICENKTVENIEQNFISVGTKKYLCNENGIDFVEFFISTNLGEDVKPLVKVASGGEISRIMLALKATLAKSDKLPILIFDEIDTGVSGRVAQKVGNVLFDLASKHQIIAITHLPQIAGFANRHFAVEKKKVSDRVISSIRLLTEDERVSEIAKLIAGEDITDAAIKGAQELINKAN